MIPDGGSAFGSVSTVRRVGNTVLRPTGVWTPAVHAVLRHLAAVHCNGAPRVIGINSDGWEQLSYLPGTVALRPWPPALCTDEGLLQIAAWLRNYHRAIAGFRPPPDAVWRVPGCVWQPGQIIRHGDLGPWNMVWNGSQFIGVIDWDMAEPGSEAEDIAQLAWHTIPLGRDVTGLDPAVRLRRLCAACDAQPDTVVTDVIRLIDREDDRIVRLSARGLHPWTLYLERGDRARLAEERAWILQHLKTLV